jgi:predicted nucleic acid-binding Zn ribbon protein
MSVYRGPQSLGTVLQTVIDTLGIQQRLDEARIVAAWAEVAGPQISGVSEAVWTKGDCLYVRVTSSAWRQELHLNRSAWCDRLNEQLGRRLVADIVFR